MTSTAVAVSAVLVLTLVGALEASANQPPAAPVLVSPQDGETYLVGFGPSTFMVRASDPDGDHYHATITVAEVVTGATVMTFDTATAPSGIPTKGSAPFELPSGEYRWSAVAVDRLGATSVPSEERRFAVTPPPPNTPPETPALLAPAPGVTIPFGEPAKFVVNATDADSEPYRGLVTVSETATGAVAAAFETHLAPSGVDSFGRPADPLPAGDYLWTARAVDLRGAESDLASAVAFTVVPAGPSAMPLPGSRCREDRPDCPQL